MRVVLQAETGGRAGHRIWMGANQRVFVGGTEWAEFSVPGDPELADIQFVVETDFLHCRIRNLQCARALLVNGTEVTERTLVDGDIVAAGGTRFTVRVQETAAIARKQKAIRSGRTESLASIPYRMELCVSRLPVFRGSESHARPAEIARMLAARHALYLLLHVTRSEIVLPADLEQATDLFGLGERPLSECIRHSPILLSPADPVDRFDVLSQAWAKDAVVAIFTSVERAELLKRLRRDTLWLFPPEMIRAKLANGPPHHIRNVMRGIKAILVKSDSTEEWSVFANPDAAPLWLNLGFPNPPSPVMEAPQPGSTLRRGRKHSSFRPRSA
jgi:hypothetical protein